MSKLFETTALPKLKIEGYETYQSRQNSIILSIQYYNNQFLVHKQRNKSDNNTDKLKTIEFKSIISKRFKGESKILVDDSDLEGYIYYNTLFCEDIGRLGEFVNIFIRITDK